MIESYIYRLSRYTGMVFILLLSFQSVSCQEQPADSASAEADSIAQADSIRNVHSPRKATIFSTVLPGLGQIYNKKYWKVPVIYATFGVMTYFIVYNNKYYRYFKGAYAYKLSLEGQPNFLNISPVGIRQMIWRRWGKPSFESKYPELAFLSEESLKTGMDTYRRWRDMNGLGFIAFYALQVIDANVDAHFFNYDISQDLSINVRPGIVINDNLMGYALGLKINLHF